MAQRMPRFTPVSLALAPSEKPSTLSRPSSSQQDTLTTVGRDDFSVLQEQPQSAEHGHFGHDADIDEVEDHVIMSIDRALNGKIGCAYYIARHELLCCMQDIVSGGKDVMETLRLDIDPSVVLMSPRSEEFAAAGFTQRQSSLINTDIEHRPLPWETIVRPASDFNYESAINKLTSTDTFRSHNIFRFLVPGESVDYDEQQPIDELGLIDQQGKLLTITSLLEIDNKVSIGCVGAVIGHIQRKRANEYLQHDPAADAAYRISRLEMFTLQNTMLLNTDTLSSLQIIQTETHPNVSNQGPSSSGSKESLSVYGLFHNLAKTPQGKSKLRQMFLRPCLDPKVVTNRHEFISVFARPENQAACISLSRSLSRVKNMRSTITLLRKGVERGSSGTIKSGVWSRLLEFCYHSIDIRNTLKEVVDSQDLDVLATVDHTLNELQLQRLGKMIHNVVDSDESFEQHRTVVKRGVNIDLDNVKNMYDGMEDILAQIAVEITNTMPIHIERSLNVVFLPQLGFHVTVPLDEKTNLPVWEGDELWERRFRTEKYQYFKNEKMREMDSKCGDPYAIICDTEIEISHDLAQSVLQSEEWLINASNFCGELDSLLALTHGAIQHKLTRPKVVEDNVMDIKNGRHILQEMTVAACVPNNAFIVGGNEHNSSNKGPAMILLTGPNYSGKSVYKKQVALIVYMCQIGSFVPAEAATLGITDKILTRINTAETVSKIQSAFMVDLQQIAYALNSCTSRSLLIIDEFGKGTDSCDGAGLAFGVLKYLLDSGTEAPKVLASTHFHEIFERGDLNQRCNLALAHMEVRVQPLNSNDRTHANEVTYLYHLTKGRSTLSYGNQCAMMSGIPDKIVERAMLLADLVVQGEDLVASCAALPEAELEELENAELTCRMFLDKDFADASLQAKSMLEEFHEVGRTDVSDISIDT